MKRSLIYGLCLFVFMQGNIHVDLYAQQFDKAFAVMLAGKWVPENPANIDFERLPRLPKSDHIIIHDVRDLDGHRVNQHNYLVYHDGQFWAMWSDGPGVPRMPPGQHRNRAPGHEQPQQKVAYSTSKDGLKWSKAKDITDTPDAPDGWIARGFWVREGKLLALASRFTSPSYHGSGLALHAFEWKKKTKKWKPLGVAYENTLNNFPPAKLPSGEWMMSRRDSTQNVNILYGGIKAYNDWTSVPVVSYGRTDLKATEPSWWVLPDNKVAALYRDNKKSGFLYRSFSLDSGKSWTDPVKTNFPDATSKFNTVRLKDGRYVLVSNPNPKQRDPMTIAVSDDGVVFNKMIYLVGGRNVDYPDIIEHNGYIYVAFAGAKQSVELIRVKISDMDNVGMPDTPIEVKQESTINRP